MAQLHLYVPDQVADELKQRARARGLTVSRYLASIVGRQVGGAWPDGFFEEIAGGWQGERLKRPPQGKLERRERR